MYNLFISHAWHRSEHYNKVVEWLDDSEVSYKNYSVPEDDPLNVKTNKALKESLTNQISPASCVLILAGMYAVHSEWIEYEIDEAVRMGKYIIGVKPWGQERIPQVISDNADVMVGWNQKSVVEAIKNSK